MMKPVVITLGIGTCVLLLLCSCVTQKEFLYLNDQLVALNKRVDELEDQTEKKLSGKLNAELQAIRDRQADNVAEVDQVKTEIQRLSGQVQENNHWIKRSIERDTTEQDQVKESVSDLEAQIAELEAKTDRVYDHLGLKIQDQQPEEVSTKEPDRAEKTPIPVPETEEADEVSAEKRLYEVNLALFKNEEYEEAISGFQNFIDKYPKSTLADNAQFWIGECYMGLKQYEQAILAYQNVIKKYPKGNKVPNALLRQAKAFYEIKDKTSSKLLLKKLIAKYPQSREAGTAKKRLEQMK
ncbi:MAG: tol-pal system protein YbgF [Desulfatiglandaceae bacterium]